MSLSLLSIPGGKSRAVNVLNRFVPKDTTTVYSPFFGGGAFEFYLATTRNIHVVASDKFEPLVNFWKCIKTNKNKVLAKVPLYMPMTKASFNELREFYSKERSKYHKAAIFFALNHSSFNGGMASYSPSLAKRDPKWLLTKITQCTMNNIDVNTIDFKQAIAKVPTGKGHLLFVDPPYMTSRHHYGWKGEMHRNFDHRGLADLLISNAKNICLLHSGR
jgi:DNA adenine methylase